MVRKKHVPVTCLKSLAITSVLFEHISFQHVEFMTVCPGIVLIVESDEKYRHIVDDRKVDHPRETYKEQLFSPNKIKINLKILRYIEKYDFIKQIK